MSAHALLKSTCSSCSLLRNSSAAFLTESRLERSSSKKMASLPVSSFSSAIVFSALSLFRAARYVVALCSSKACDVSAYDTRQVRGVWSLLT